MVDRPRFSTTRMREGYAVDDVDAAVDRVMAALAAEGTPTIAGEEIQGLRFTPVRLGTGYDMGEVDAWLDTVVTELNRRGAGAAGTPAAGPPAAEPAPPVVPSPAPASVTPEPAPGAIEEVGRGIDPVKTALAVIGVLLLALVVLYVV